MSDIGSPSPADSSAPETPATPAPAPQEAPVDPPRPIKDGPLPKEPEEPKPPRTAREIAQEAKKAVDKADTEGKPLPKSLKEDREAAEPKPKVEEKPKAETPEAKAERERGEHGHFAPKDKPEQPKPEPGSQQEADRVAPPRFKQEAREAWDKLGPEHEVLRSETHRAFRELEAGIQKYKPAAEAYETTYKHYDELAKKSGIDSKATLDGYVSIDLAIHSDDPKVKAGAIEHVLKQSGTDPVSYAKWVLQNYAGADQQPGQKPNGNGQAAPQADPMVTNLVNNLRKEIETLKQQVGGVTQNIQSQEAAQHQQTLDAWAEKSAPLFKSNPSIAAATVKYVYEDGLLPDDAYVKAVAEAQDAARELLQGSSPRSAPSQPSPAAHTPKGEKSITGSPSSGSDPANSTRPDEPVKDTVRRILASQVS